MEIIRKKIYDCKKIKESTAVKRKFERGDCDLNFFTVLLAK